MGYDDNIMEKKKNQNERTSRQQAFHVPLNRLSLFVYHITSFVNSFRSLCVQHFILKLYALSSFWYFIVGYLIRIRLRSLLVYKLLNSLEIWVNEALTSLHLHKHHISRWFHSNMDFAYHREKMVFLLVNFNPLE